ncbi:ribonuclease H [Tersicoccus solisilvae]|uniref:Ribonuclease H n=1 Tax=Tersicoccus solisilvae TaxID=1882339 RepID=A0ABQ1P2E0_9MICC|nr:ribonuclease HI family protein [Tersicoccus solisilvae]GGC89684.1 ribonuclease H [Tersicoccus solisilvae]
MTIIAAADGSALGNPGPAGWAWFVDEDCWAAGGWPHGTNNMGELMAVLDLLESTAHVSERLQILCDSQYVINCVTKWMPGWKRKGWRKADGKPVLNVDLLKRIDTAIAGRDVAFDWVKGHAGHDLNEAADERARAAATAYSRSLPADTGPGFRTPVAAGAVPAGAADVATAGTVPAAATTTAPAAAPGTTPRPEPESRFTGAADDLEADLFSVLADDTDIAQLEDEELVVQYEQELLDPRVRADVARLAALLHPDFTEVGASGRIWDRDSTIDLVSNADSGAVQFEQLQLERIDPTTILLVWRSTRDGESAVRSSWWVRDGQQWRLRFHQGTPTS